jgi:hypothetical protein
MPAMTIYVPFSDTELVDGATAMADLKKAEGGRCIVHGSWWQSPLSSVKKEQTLYVLAHGRYRAGDVIGGTLPNGKNIWLTAAELAKQLISDGLTKSFGDLRLLVCWGGYMGADVAYGTHTVQRNATHAPFAGQLCGALKAKGFSRIIVTGYVGCVMFPKKGSKIVPRGVWTTDQNDKMTETNDTGGTPLIELLNQMNGTKTLSNAHRTVWY